MVEWNAGEYHRQSSLQETLARARLAKLTFAESEQVLDVGCGDGRITAQIATQVPRGGVLGIDPSHKMIAFAAENYGAAAHPNLRFEVADARALPYHNQFDVVVSFNALHWVAEQLRALQSICQSLRIGGRADLQFVPAGPRQSLEDTIEETRKLARWAGHFEGFECPYFHPSADEYRALARRAGLTVVDIQIEDGSWDFGSRAGYRAFCDATFVAWTQRLPAEENAAFIDDVLDRYAAVIAQTPAEVHTFKFYQMEVKLLRGDPQ